MADLPGVPQDNLEVSVTHNVLTIKGMRPGGFPARRGIRSFNWPRFFVSFKLNNALDTDQVDAELKNGVLQLRIPKAKAAVARQVDIKVA